MSKTLRIGMVGMGFIADWHQRGFATVPGTEFAGLCQDFRGTPSEIAAKRARLSERAKALGTRAYESFDEMVADPSLDALIIGSVNPYHFDQIRRGLAAGKHLLVEKPVVTDLAQLEELRRLAASAGRVLFPAHNFAYRGVVREAARQLAAGVIGRRVASTFVVTHSISQEHATGWRSVKALGAGGTLMDSGHHLVYQSLYLLGMPVALSAFTSKQVLTNMECEDTAQVSLQYADGSVAMIMQSWASGHGDANGIRITGDKGCLQITDALYLNGQKLNTDSDYAGSFANLAQAFVDAVNGGPGPISDLDAVRDTLRIIQGAYRSAETRTVITL